MAWAGRWSLAVPWVRSSVRSRTWRLRARGRERAIQLLAEHHDLDELAASNVLGYLDEEREVTGALPTDRTIVLQRFRDELGDWRICLLTPFGARVHAPWALAIEHRLRDSLGVEVQPIWSDDGIVVRLPATEDCLWRHARPDAGRRPRAGLGTVVVADSAEAAVLIAGRRDRGAGHRHGRLARRSSPAAFGRTPHGRCCSRGAGPASARHSGRCGSAPRSCSSVASRYGSFPIILETYREVLSDVFDLPALRQILAAIERREIRVVSVETRRASPFASSLLFDYIATYMYEGDAPLLDRRAQALTLDRDLLRELLGAEQLRELLDARCPGRARAGAAGADRGAGGGLGGRGA